VRSAGYAGDGAQLAQAADAALCRFAPWRAAEDYRPETGTAEEQKAVERLIDYNGLFNVSYEVALDVSRYGTGIFKIRYDAEP